MSPRPATVTARAASGHRVEPRPVLATLVQPIDRSSIGQWLPRRNIGEVLEAHERHLGAPT